MRLVAQILPRCVAPRSGRIPRMLSGKRRRVVALAYDQLCTFEFGIVVEVFGLPRPELRVPWYEFEVCSFEHGPIRATGGIQVTARRGLPAFRHAGTIILPGWRRVEEAPPDEGSSEEETGA